MAEMYGRDITAVGPDGVKIAPRESAVGNVIDPSLGPSGAFQPIASPSPTVVMPIPVPSFRKVEGDGYINWRMRPKPMGSADE